MMKNTKILYQNSERSNFIFMIKILKFYIKIQKMTISFSTHDEKC
jgi:hypothetical protein